MSGGPVLEQAGSRLLELLRESIVPGVLQTQDSIQITYPNSQQDYRLGVFFYDVEEVRPYGTPTPVRVSETQRRGPSRCFALHALVYANRKSPFDSMTALDEMSLMEAVIRTVHNALPFELEGETVHIRFDPVDQERKSALWQSLSAPLQPAVYLVVEPLAVPSTRLERFVPVRELALKSQKKEETSP